MRKLTAFEIASVEFKTQLTSMNIEGIGEGKTKYQFTIELQRISFDCDKNYLGICNDLNGKQTGYAIILKRENETVEGIMQKYSVSKDILELYNNLNELKIGDKIIIPSLTNEKI